MTKDERIEEFSDLLKDALDQSKTSIEIFGIFSFFFLLIILQVYVVENHLLIKVKMKKIMKEINNNNNNRFKIYRYLQLLKQRRK
jgi:hypothetical protein